MYGCDAGYFYAAKCIMAEMPMKTVTILFVLLLFAYGHMLRICEE